MDIIYSYLIKTNSASSKVFNDYFFYFERSGLAEIQILHIYDASHMTAKLLNLNCTNSLTDTGNWYQVQDNSKIIKRELSLYYLHPEFR